MILMEFVGIVAFPVVLELAVRVILVLHAFVLIM